MLDQPRIQEGQTLTGALFGEPMRAEAVCQRGADTWVLGLVGKKTSQFRSVTLHAVDLVSLQTRDDSRSFTGDGQLLLRGLQAYVLGIAYEFGVNQWLEQSQLITSLDLAKQTEVLPGLRQVNWDLVIVDEAHRMAAADAEHKTQRYRPGELLCDTTDHLLLLTGTPHRGDPVNFSYFLQLLDADAYADVKSIRQAMERRHAPFYLRRTKEALVYFPERQRLKLLLKAMTRPMRLQEEPDRFGADDDA